MGTPTVAPSNPRAGFDPVLMQDSRIRRWTVFNFTFSNSYATGGEAFDPVGTYPGLVPSTPEIVIIPAKNGYTFWWDSANKKVLAYNGTTQISATTDLSTTPGQIQVLIGCP